MKRVALFTLLTAATALLAPTAAKAGDGFRFGFDRHRSRVQGMFDRHSHRSPRHTFELSFGNRHRQVVHHPHSARSCRHQWAPRYQRTWIPPVYRNVICGYDHCGRPIFRSVIIRAGYWHQVVVGHSCSSCGFAP